MEENEKKKKASGKKQNPYLVIQILGVVFALLFFTFCYSAFHLAKDLISNQKDKKGFNELSAIVALLPRRLSRLRRLPMRNRSFRRMIRKRGSC